MDTETLNKLSKFKQTVENDRVNICKQIKIKIVEDKIDKSLTLNKSGIISQILSAKKYNVGGLSNYKDIMDKYTCFICTGKYNVKVGEFDILTDNEFKAVKMEQYYKDLKKGSSKLEEIDNTIFKGLTNLYKKYPTKNQVTCTEGNYDTETGICADTNVYSKLNKKVITKLDKKKADEINENAIYLLNIKGKLIGSINIYYTSIAKKKDDTAAAVTLKDENIKDLINDVKYFDEYKQYMAFIPDKKVDKFLSIMYSPGIPKPKDDMVITVKMVLDSVKPAKISKTNDYTQLRKKMIGTLLKEPFTNYNEFTEGYVNYIKEYGFRK